MGVYNYVWNAFTSRLEIVSDLSGYVPYTGATGDVNLNGHNLTTTGDITGETLYGANLELSDYQIDTLSVQWTNADYYDVSSVELKALGGYGDFSHTGDGTLGKIRFVKDERWTSTESTRDSHIEFITSNNGVEISGVSILKDGTLNATTGTISTLTSDEIYSGTADFSNEVTMTNSAGSSTYFYGSYGEMKSLADEDVTLDMWNDNGGDAAVALRYSDNMFMLGTTYDLTANTGLNMNTDYEWGMKQLPEAGYTLAILGDTKINGDLNMSANNIIDVDQINFKDNQIAISAASSGLKSIAIGSSAVTADYGTAIGYLASAAQRSMAIGVLSNSSGGYSVSLGYNADSTGSGSSAIGRNSLASGRDSSAIGKSTIASATNSMAFGTNTNNAEANTFKVGGDMTNTFIDTDVGIGVSAANTTARLHLAAQTATAGTAPIKLISSATGMTTAEEGSLEFVDNKLCFTNIDTCRVIDRTSDVAVSTVTVENTTTETTMWTGAMAANSLRAGNLFKFHADGIIQNGGATAADQITLRIKVGGSTVATLAPVTKAIAVGSHWHIDANATQRTIGASGSRAVHIDLVIDDNEAAVVAVATIDTTANMDVTVTAQWASDDADNIISLYQGYMEYKN